MATNVRISGANPDSRQESDIRFNYNNLNEIICASTQLGGNQPMSFSTDGGATWSQASLPGVTGDARQGDPTIDWTSDGTAWTVTIGIAPMNASLIMRTFKSVDQGATWTFDSDVGGGQTAMDKQALWVDHNASSPFKDNMYLIWHNGKPAFVSRRVGPNGAWSAPLQVSGSETTGTGIGLDIKTNQNGDVFAFWNDTGSRGLFVAKSTDGGVTFGTPVKVATTNGAFQVGVPAQNSRLVLIYPSGAAWGTATEDVVVVCWMDLAGGSDCDSTGDAPGGDVGSNCKTRIFFARSTDGGATWGSPIKLSDQNAKNDQIFQRLALDEATGAMMVVYYDTILDTGRIKTNFWMQQSFDRGVSWTAPLRVTTAETDETSTGATSSFQYGDYIGLTGFAGNFFPAGRIAGAAVPKRSGARPSPQTPSTSSSRRARSGRTKSRLGAQYAPAYWLAVSGFSNAELALTSAGALSQAPNPAPVVTVTLDPSLNTGLTAAQLATDRCQPADDQSSSGRRRSSRSIRHWRRTRRRFSIRSRSRSTRWPRSTRCCRMNSVVLTLNASLTVGQITRTASADIELVAGENPYYENVDPSGPCAIPQLAEFRPAALQDDRAIHRVETRSRFNATMTTNPADAPGFVANVIANLTAGGGVVGSDSFESGLTQDEHDSALEFLQKDDDGNFVFNFAVARVRLKGNTAGAHAVKVRVFFRMFNARRRTPSSTRTRRIGSTRTVC